MRGVIRAKMAATHADLTKKKRLAINPEWATEI